MGRTYRKLCVECVREFESVGSKGCPFCGSEKWNFLNERGGVRVPYLEAIEGRPGPNGEVIIDAELSRRRMRDLERRFPARVG